MQLTRLFFALLLTLAMTGGAAAQTPCPLPYKVFEFAVPHLDLAACPADLPQQKAFCRASTGNDAVHVFVFAEDGDQCLLSVKSYTEFDFSVK